MWKQPGANNCLISLRKSQNSTSPLKTYFSMRPPAIITNLKEKHTSENDIQTDT